MSAPKYCEDPDHCTYSDCPTAFCDRGAKHSFAAPTGSALIRDLIEIARPCNPQHPSLQEFDECPADHPYCCGVCAVIHRARAFLNALNEKGQP